MSTKEEIQLDSNLKHGLVIYSDGGAKPNPGPAGWGMHGYLFSFSKPKKGSGNPAYVLTTHGYKTKEFKDKLKELPEEVTNEWLNKFNISKNHPSEVTPIHYVDGHGSFYIDSSNNVAEIIAACNAFKYAYNYDIQYVCLQTDSKYVVGGLSGWIDQWAKNNWRKRDGSPVSNENEWKELKHAYDCLVNRGVAVFVEWVKGHNDHVGNDKADESASIGVLRSQRKHLHSEIKSTPAEGYWKYEVEKHPFISNRRIYFNTLNELCIPGEYYMGEHGKEDEMLGKRTSDGAYSVVRLNTPESMIEMLRDHHCKLAMGHDSIIVGRLDKLFNPNAHRLINEYGDIVFVQPNQNRFDINFIDGEPLSREQEPPRLAMRAVENITVLADRLDAVMHPEIGMSNKTLEQRGMVLTDLTDILYEKEIKTDKKGSVTTTTKLKSDYNVGFASLDVDAKYVSGDKIETASVRLILGIDMLDRNALKRLETHNPKVALLSWLEAPGVFRYATVIETADARGIWAGMYSNQRFVKLA